MEEGVTVEENPAESPEGTTGQDHNYSHSTEHKPALSHNILMSQGLELAPALYPVLDLRSTFKFFDQDLWAC